MDNGVFWRQLGNEGNVLPQCGVRPGDVLYVNFKHCAPVFFLVHAAQNGQQSKSSRKAPLFGNPSIREMMVIVRQKDGEFIEENAEVTEVYKLQCHVPTDDVSIVLDLKPDPYHWLPVAGGRPENSTPSMGLGVESFSR